MLEQVLKYKLESLVPSFEIFIDTDMGTSNTGLLSTNDLQQAITNTTMMVSLHIVICPAFECSPCVSIYAGLFCDLRLF